VVNFFSVTTGKEIPFTENGDRRERVTALGVCQQDIHPCGENVLWVSAYFMSSCPWCVSEHILDPMDLAVSLVTTGQLS
jgi:DNA-binding helix-hairpin-helix protein with protein kinase domain